MSLKNGFPGHKMIRSFLGRKQMLKIHSLFGAEVTELILFMDLTGVNHKQEDFSKCMEVEMAEVESMGRQRSSFKTGKKFVAPFFMVAGKEDALLKVYRKA